MKKKIQKPFNIEAAKNGAKIETRDGDSVRILCYDRKNNNNHHINFPIIALTNHNGLESCFSYTSEGRLLGDDFNIYEDSHDLVIIEEVEVPKFSVGNWVFKNTNGEYPLLITAVTSNWYEVQDIKGYKNSIAQITIDNYFHLWTLKDAKSGDVLIREDGKYPFIFKESFGGDPFAYCCINPTDSIFIGTNVPWLSATVRPATYDEKQQFFNKLKEKGYKWDAESLTLSKIQKMWRDNEYKTISGYYTHTDSRITYSQGHSNTKENYNIFATEKQAKSALAMARISQIMANDERFGGAITDKEWNYDKKHIIIRRGNNLGIETRYCYEYLAFHTNEQAELFLKENEDLIKMYYMIG